MDFNEIRQIISAVADTDISELILKSENFELTLRKGKTVSAIETNIPVTSEAIGEAIVSTNKPSDSKRKEETPPTPNNRQKWLEITSPMVGTFYHAPAPDEAPFVVTGDRISVGQTVCIVEAMKLMNEIEAEISGQVMEIAVENGEPVEYGQTLMWVNPE